MPGKFAFAPLRLCTVLALIGLALSAHAQDKDQGKSPVSTHTLNATTPTTRTFIVNAAQAAGPFSHFWQATGFTPASDIFRADMRQQLIYAASVPHGGITHVRIHFLLSLVKAQGILGERPVYDWTSLDQAVDFLVQNNLKPFFELMGHPSPEITDFNDPKQARAWRRFVAALANHLMDRYGRGEVETWYFECWNEPDPNYFGGPNPDKLKIGETLKRDRNAEPYIKALLNYYDASSAGLKDANPRLRIGGPDGQNELTVWIKRFFEHCDRGRNALTGGPVALDFVSVHEKGGRTPKDLVPDSRSIIRDEEALLKHLRQHHPRLAALPFINDECDPLYGWSHPLPWHGGPFYAAFVTWQAGLHQLEMIDQLKANYTLLSNDNGFLGGWAARTFCARFGEGERFDMIKKPALSAMTLLALLGNERLQAKGMQSAYDPVQILATRRGTGQAAILLTHYVDDPGSRTSTRVALKMKGLAMKEPLLAHYRLDEQHANPYGAWLAMGKPAKPSPQQLATLREVMEPALLEPPRLVKPIKGKLDIALELPRPGVSLLTLNEKPAQAPGRPRDVRLERFTGQGGQRQTMVIWQGVDSRKLRTYEVQYAATADGPWRRVNKTDLLATAWLDEDPLRQASAGCYRIVAVDLWGRPGQPSPLAAYKP